MQHVVRFTTAEGRDGTHFTDSLDEAVSFVERVRNVEEASDVQLFSMTEVPVSFRTYYQVQVGESQPTPPPVRAVVSDPLAVGPGMDTHRPQAHTDESSVLDAPEQDAAEHSAAEHAAEHAPEHAPEHAAPLTAVVDSQPTVAGDSNTQGHAVDSGTPPLETRFGDQGTESAPANGRRLFSRA